MALNRVYKMVLGVGLSLGLVAGVAKQAYGQTPSPPAIQESITKQSAITNMDPILNYFSSNALSLQEQQNKMIGVPGIALGIKTTPLFGKELFGTRLATGQAEELSFLFGNEETKAGYESKSQRDVSGFSELEQFVIQQKAGMDDALGLKPNSSKLRERKVQQEKYWMQAPGLGFSALKKGGEVYYGMSFKNRMSFQQTETLDQLTLEGILGLKGGWKKGQIGSSAFNLPKTMGSELNLGIGGARYFKRTEEGVREQGAMETPFVSVETTSGKLSQDPSSKKYTEGEELKISMLPQSKSPLLFQQSDIKSLGVKRTISQRGLSLTQETGNIGTGAPGERLSFSGNNLGLSYFSDNADVTGLRIKQGEREFSTLRSPVSDQYSFKEGQRAVALTLHDMYSKLFMDFPVYGVPARFGVGTDLLMFGLQKGALTGFYQQEDEKQLIRLLTNNATFEKSAQGEQESLKVAIPGLAMYEETPKMTHYIVPRMASLDVKATEAGSEYSFEEVGIKGIVKKLRAGDVYLARYGNFPAQVGWYDEAGAFLHYAGNNFNVIYSESHLDAISLKHNFGNALSAELAKPDKKPPSARFIIQPADWLKVDMIGERDYLAGFEQVTTLYELSPLKGMRLSHLYQRNKPSITNLFYSRDIGKEDKIRRLGIGVIREDGPISKTMAYMLFSTRF